MKNDAKSLVYAKATFYPPFVRVWVPNQPYLHQKEGYESKRNGGSFTPSDDSEPYETNEEHVAGYLDGRMIHDLVIEFFAYERTSPNSSYY